MHVKQGLVVGCYSCGKFEVGTDGWNLSEDGSGGRGNLPKKNQATPLANAPETNKQTIPLGGMISQTKHKKFKWNKTGNKRGEKHISREYHLSEE